MIRRIKEDELCLYRCIQKQKMTLTGHVLRGSSDEDVFHILDGKLEAGNCRTRKTKTNIRNKCRTEYKEKKK